VTWAKKPNIGRKECISRGGGLYAETDVEKGGEAIARKTWGSTFERPEGPADHR